MKKYITVKESSKATHLKIELYYDLGGMNYFTGRPEERGYYLSVTPVSRQDRGGWVSESYTAFTGLKQRIKTVSRKSAKAEQAATEAAVQIEKTLIEYVCNKNGLEVMEA